MPLEYRKHQLSDTVTAYIFKKADFNKHKPEVDNEMGDILFSGGEKKVVMGATYLQLNGYGEMAKKLKWDRKLEKVFIVEDV